MITRADMAQILAIVQAHDRRTIGQADIAVWTDALHDLHPTECIDAVREYFRTQTGWLMPAHIRAIVMARRADRADCRCADQHHAALAAVEYERPSAHLGYLAASAVLQDAIRAKYHERLGQPVPAMPAEPFRRWTPKAKDAPK